MQQAPNFPKDFPFAVQVMPANAENGEESVGAP